VADVTVGLADAIAALREELLAAMAEGKDAAMRSGWRRLMMVRMSEQPPGLGSIALTVITRTPQETRHEAAWAQMQDELAALSSDSKHLMAENAGHYVHLDEPDLVVKAIQDLVRRTC
jgi:pimeloyl-ACP methyl ester carboxylesterase